MFVAFDLGTSKTVAVVGDRNTEGTIDIAAVECIESNGIEGGAIVDIDATVASIQKVISNIELRIDRKIVSCTVGISGNYIDSVCNASMASLGRQEVSQEDIRIAIEAAKNTAPIPKDTRILHTIPLNYTLDNKFKVRDPKGMSALRLDAEILLIYASEYALRNIETCFSRLQIRVDNIVLNQLAESYAVLDESEKRQGVCLVKIGAGTTDVGIYLDGTLRHYGFLPIGGALVTEDMLSVIHTKTANAEEIKKKYACAKRELARGDHVIRIANTGRHSTTEMQRSTLAEIIEPRYTEIFHLINNKIDKSQLRRRVNSGGIVLTGGAAKIEGGEALALEIFRMPVRLGYSSAYKDLGASGPEFSTAIGLLEYAITHNKASQKNKNNKTMFRSLLNRWFN